MQKRQLGQSGLYLSEVALGCEHLQGKPYEEVKPVIDAALDSGINAIDLFMSEPQVRSNIGKALQGRREQVIIQGHIGAVWTADGQYARSRDLEQCKLYFADLLTRLQTDYIDIGIIHFLDEENELDEILENGVMDYMLELKKQGTLKAVGIGSHNPLVALRAVKTGLLDMLFFSLNPAYDMLPENTVIDALFEAGTYQQTGILGINPKRDELYKTCEAMGVGITVMKGLGGGMLLSEKASPFGMALSPAQLIHYALTRPAVASVMVGCRTPEEVAAAVQYERATDDEKDYSVILGATKVYSATGRCMYCNHCLPCPAKIDIAQVNKYLDLALIYEQAPETVREHYAALPATAKDCIACGACEGRCPFKVPVVANMQKAVSLFGN